MSDMHYDDSPFPVRADLGDLIEQADRLLNLRLLTANGDAP